MSDTSTDTTDERLAEADRRVELAERRVAFLEAGIVIDPEESPLGNLLYTSWTGPADANAIKARAKEIGYSYNVNPHVDAAARKLNEEQQLIRQGLSGGTPAGAAPTETPDPWDAAYKLFHEQVAKGIPPDRARVEFGLEIIGAAKRGDKRVIFDHEAHVARAKEIEALEGAYG